MASGARDQFRSVLGRLTGSPACPSREHGAAWIERRVRYPPRRPNWRGVQYAAELARHSRPLRHVRRMSRLRQAVQDSSVALLDSGTHLIHLERSPLVRFSPTPMYPRHSQGNLPAAMRRLTQPAMRPYRYRKQGPSTRLLCDRLHAKKTILRPAD